MDINRAKQLFPVIQAYIDGKPIKADVSKVISPYGIKVEE